MISAFGVDHGGELSKAEKDRASIARQALGTQFGPVHGAIAGKGAKGKAKTMGTQTGMAIAGSLVGAGGGAVVGSTAGPGGAVLGGLAGYKVGQKAGNWQGTRVAHRRGWLKEEG